MSHLAPQWWSLADLSGIQPKQLPSWHVCWRGYGECKAQEGSGESRTVQYSQQEVRQDLHVIPAWFVSESVPEVTNLDVRTNYTVIP